MTEAEWHGPVLELMVGLWPRAMDKITPEQMKSYKKVCSRYPSDWVLEAMRECHMEEKYFPDPSSVSKRLRKADARPENRKDSESHEPFNRWEHQRQHWLGHSQDENKRQKINNMSELEIEVRVRQWEFNSFAEQGSPAKVFYFGLLEEAKERLNNAKEQPDLDTGD